nr:MAG TPA: hypothetical protein [Caudoviricetes sp.]
MILTPPIVFALTINFQNITLINPYAVLVLYTNFVRY